MRFALFSLVLVSALCAQTPDLYPLTGSAGNTTALEGVAPYRAPFGFTQTLISRRFSIAGLPSTFSDWDMMDVSPDGRYLFVPSEASSRAGLFRIDTTTGAAVSFFVGSSAFLRNSNPATFDATRDNFARLDPCTLTPWGTVITGEETTGGRLIEVMNPFASSNFVVRWNAKVPAVSHEGLRFDRSGTLYFVDESNSGSIYKYVPTVPGDLANGQTFVLTVLGYGGSASSNWNASSNLGALRTGAALWVPITDAQGNAVTSANPFAFGLFTGGRTAADEVDGVPYGRPEDIVIGTLANGNECLYFTATSENTVYSVELMGGTQAMVRVYASNNTVNEATGLPLGTGTPRINSPDNLEIDTFGDIYIIEDQNPGDIWKARDLNGDGVAESIGLFVSLGVSGSEPTGMRIDPNDPYRFYSITQHPSSDNDAIFALQTRPFPGTDDGALFEVGVNQIASRRPGEFAKRVTAGDQVNLRVSSVSDSLAGNPFLVAIQARTSTTVLTLPFANLYLDLNQPFFFLVDPAQLPPLLLPTGGFAATITAPAGLSGLIVRLQAGVASAQATNGSLSLTDAFDLFFL